MVSPPSDTGADTDTSHILSWAGMLLVDLQRSEASGSKARWMAEEAVPSEVLRNTLSSFSHCGADLYPQHSGLDFFFLPDYLSQHRNVNCGDE